MLQEVACELSADRHDQGPTQRQFAYFRQMLFPFAGVTAEVDITDFAARRQGRPFFLSFLYAVVRRPTPFPSCAAASGRTARGGIRLVSALLHRHEADGVYVYCTVEGDLPYEAFVALGQREVCHRNCHKRKFCNSDCKQKE